MNNVEFKQWLRDNKINERCVSLDGEVGNESYVLEHDDSGGVSVYYSERGLRTEERWFDGEPAAYSYLLKRLGDDPNCKER